MSQNKEEQRTIDLGGYDAATRRGRERVRGIKRIYIQD
jgi:hypothetical protein